MQILVKTKVGNKTALRKFIIENYNGSPVGENYTSVNDLTTLDELHKFISECSKPIGVNDLKPIICPVDDNLFELRFERYEYFGN